VHGRGLAVLVSLVAACALPSAASADAMTPGTYDVTLNGGSVQIGSLLSPIPLPELGPLPVAIGSSPINISLPSIATIPGTFSGPVSGGTMSGSYTVYVPTANLSVDPSTGSATLDVSLYASFTVQVNSYVTLSTSCTLGDANSPITMHLSTAAGSPWTALTGNFGLADKTFVVPTPTCDDGTVQAIFALVMGGQTPGNNTAQVTGKATREPDPTPAPATTPPSGSTGTPPASTPTTPQSTTTPPGCVVPKLKGKTLKQIKRSLKAAHCGLGKVTRVKSHKKKGTVVKQKTPAGKHLPAGAKVPVTLAKGK
jgi:PASTA domain